MQAPLKIKLNIFEEISKDLQVFYFSFNISNIFDLFKYDINAKLNRCNN